MGYSTLSDMENKVPRDKIDQLCKDQAGGAATVVGDLIEEADGVIDLYTTQGWTSVQRKGCSRALAVEMLFSRHGTGKVPREHKEAADAWRGRLETVGLRVSGSWTRIAFDPAQDETDEELDQLLTGGMAT